MSNASPPPGIAVDDVSASADMAAFDRLPDMLRDMLCDAPFDVAATDVLTGYRVALGRFGSPAMAIASTAGHVSKLLAEAARAARAGERAAA